VAEGASFGQLLREYRRKAGLTQEALAQRTDLSVDAIAGLERGRRTAPHVDTLRRLVAGLQLTSAERDTLLHAADRSSGPTPPMHELRSNVPVALSSFVGRTHALAAVTQLLTGADRRTRLLTLVGPGGIGKTRLAHEVARALAETAAAERFPDGVWLADLSGLDDPALIPGEVAGAIEIERVTAGLTLEGLSRFVSTRRLLLILDNCEHLVDGCARLADALLRAAPNIAVLATSREALGLGGEVVWPVTPLSVGDAEHLLTSEAGQLFVERARAVQPEFQLVPEQMDAVAGVCRQLDGIPLAIELAAARVGALDVPTLARGLARQFVVLRNANRLAPARHQTLDALVQWSYDLLPLDEQQLFSRLAVFVDGWDIDAALAIASNERLTPATFIELHSRLVDKSLVTRIQDRAGNARYMLLQTLREFALQLLRSADQLPVLRERHGRYYLEWLQRKEDSVEGPEQVVILHQIEQELDNVRAALDWAFAAERPEPALRVAWCLAVLAWLRGYLEEIDTRLTRLLESPSARTVSPEVLAGAEVALGYVAFYRGQLGRAHQLVRHGLTQLRELGCEEDSAKALVWFGLILDAHSQTDAARACFVEALDVFRRGTNLFWTARAATNLGRCLARLGEVDAAVPFLDEALLLRRQIGDQRGVANTLHHLADARESAGELVRAQALAAEALSIARSVGDRFVTVRALIGLGRVAYARGEMRAAAEYLDQALTMAERDGFGHEVAEVAGVRGLVARGAGCLERAAQLGEIALVAARQHGRDLEAARALFLVGTIAGRPRGLALLRESLSTYRQVEDRTGMALAVAGLATLVEDRQAAGRWFAAAEGVLRAAGHTWSLERRELEQALAGATAGLPIDFDRVVEQALSG
jgi:predicted ATPase/transcriptional regulator with XRE-family HTH domain